jgi:tetratricopeptide (TPR) repeat protein
MAKNKADKKQTLVNPQPIPQNNTTNKSPIKSVSFWQAHRMPVLALVALSLILYIYSVTFEYALDDMLYITANQFTKKGFGGIWDLLTQESLVGFWGMKKDLLAGGRYRPLTLISYAIEQGLWGSSPQISHFINVILYAVLAVVLYRLLVRLVGKYTPQGWAWYISLPFVATALYVAHPLHVEWVANIKGRMEMLTIIFAVSTIYYTFKYLDTQQIKYLGISFALFMLGLFTKENGLTLVGIIPITIYYFRDKTSTQDYLKTLAPLLVGTVLFLAIRYAVIGYFLGGGGTVDATELLNDPFLGATTAQKFATIFYTMGLYIKLLFVPLSLTHDYYPKQIPIIGWADPRAIVPLLLYLAMGVYALLGLARRDIPSYCIWFYLLSFSLVSNLLFPIGTFMNDRFMDMPSIGFCLLLAYLLVVALPKWLTNPQVRSIATGLFLAILAFYSVRTLARVPVWQSNETLFLNDVNVSTNSTKVLTSAGGTLIDVKLPQIKDPKARAECLQQAVGYLNRAIEIYPQNVNALLLLGSAYLTPEARNMDKLLDAYKNILVINPQHDKALTNLSIISEGNNTPEEVDKLVAFLENTVVKNAPDSFIAYDALGVLYGKKKNDLNNAIRYFNEALKYKKDAGTMQDLGVAYGMKQDFENALKINLEALTLDPQNAQLLRNIGITYQNMGNAAKAQEYLNQAAAYAPSK